MSKTLLLTINVHGVGPEAASTPEADLYGRYAHGRYTYRVGLGRILDLLAGKRLKATFFWPVSEARRCRQLLQRCVAEGHEIASHGMAFEDLSQLASAEYGLLRDARDQLAELSGRMPVGFRCAAGSFSENTVPILSELGYLYDSSFIDDDRPYPLEGDGGPGMLELPWAEGLCDATYFRNRLTQDRAQAHFTEQLRALMAADGYACFTLHPRADIGVGRAARLAMLESVLDEASGAHDIRFSSCSELARAGGAGFE